MKTLGTSVLIFQWMALALALPVAVNIGGVSPTVAWAVLGAGTVIIAAAIATLPKKLGVGLGWAAQGTLVVAGIAAPMALILAAMFIGLWLMAIRLGGQVDRAKANRELMAAEEEGYVTTND